MQTNSKWMADAKTQEAFISAQVTQKLSHFFLVRNEKKRVSNRNGVAFQPPKSNASPNSKSDAIRRFELAPILLI